MQDVFKTEIYDGLTELDHNWNGNGARPVSPFALDTLAKVGIFALQDGSLQIEVMGAGDRTQAFIGIDRKGNVTGGEA